MDEQQEPKKDQPEAPPPASSKEPEPISAPAASPATAKQLTEVEEHMSGFEKSTLRWAKTAVIMSGLAAVFVCAQWWEMHEGGIDTQQSIDISQNALIASNRPWMNAIISPSGPLTFDASGAHLPLLYTLRNVGHSPAISVWSDEELYFARDPQHDTEAERERVCGSTSGRSMAMGQTIFPGEEVTGNITTGVNSATVQKATALATNKLFLNAELIVCITYQSTVGKPIWHHTALVYDLFRVDERGGTYAIQSGKESGLNELRFSRSFFRGVIAD
ncbi:MAG: hypothetical protein ABSC47_08660 [Terracidiphilus sp.]|jgi:hypothetical protein